MGDNKNPTWRPGGGMPVVTACTPTGPIAVQRISDKIGGQIELSGHCLRIK